MVRMGCTTIFFLYLWTIGTPSINLNKLQVCLTCTNIGCHLLKDKLHPIRTLILALIFIFLENYDPYESDTLAAF